MQGEMHCIILFQVYSDKVLLGTSEKLVIGELILRKQI